MLISWLFQRDNSSKEHCQHIRLFKKTPLFWRRIYSIGFKPDLLFREGPQSDGWYHQRMEWRLSRFWLVRARARTGQDSVAQLDLTRRSTSFRNRLNLFIYPKRNLVKTIYQSSTSRKVGGSPGHRPWLGLTWISLFHHHADLLSPFYQILANQGRNLKIQS